MNTMLALIFLQILNVGLGQETDNCVYLREQDASPGEEVSAPAMNWYETPSVVALSAECTGEYPLGMESGDILRQQISAYSFSNKYSQPANGRLNLVAERGMQSAWASSKNIVPENEYFQVDFIRNVRISKIATQGRDGFNRWTSKYKLKYREEDDPAFRTFQEKSGVDKIFAGNTDQSTVVSHTLAAPITARYVQIKPVEWHGAHIQLRAEFYGCVLTDRYRVMGRNVHMEYIEQQIRNIHPDTGASDTDNNIFGDTQGRSNNIDLEVLADTIYVKTALKMRGLKKLTMFSRKIVFLQGSKLDLRAPTLSQTYQTLRAGDDGNDGKHGVDGPTVEIFANTASGYINIESSGSNGNRGQNGEDGKDGLPSTHKQPDKTIADCHRKATGSSSNFNCDKTAKGKKGRTGGNGQTGGYAGKAGKGGNAGHQAIHIRNLQGTLELKTCRGTGGEASRNGDGGDGGEGGEGGKGVKCYTYVIAVGKNRELRTCKVKTQLPSQQGDTGRDANDGQTLVGPGSDGTVEQSYLTKQNLEASAISKYPLPLINIMRRLAEDRVWANDLPRAGEMLDFILILTKDREDAAELKKFAKRRLGFFNKPGFDRFGRNKFFAPLIKWEAFRNEVIKSRDYARDYETAYNVLRASIERDENTMEIKEAQQSAEIQVTKEKERLEEAKKVAISEKEAYVPAIKELESNMDTDLGKIKQLLTQLSAEARFTSNDMFALLQGVTGFLGAAAGKDLFGALGTALETAEHFATQCNSGTLRDNLGSVNKWLTFGKEYQKLEDSSDLNFDEMDIGSVPEIMQANLEMNKEGLIADLTCMLEESLPPSSVAEFKKHLERFFIAGAARIDLIAKVIDLDNDIGGYTFDIANLGQTVNELQMLRNIGDSAIENQAQEMFLDNLLTSYQNMEASFSKNLYMFYKSFEFRSLWDETQRLTDFERTASEAASANKQLQGVVQLNKALEKIDDLESKALHCFTRFGFTENVHKWEYDNINNPGLFEDLHQGKARLNLGTNEGCESCYNVRLLKMYIELYGDTTQDPNNAMPDMVHLKVRHGSASYFKDGSNNIKQFRQKLSTDTSWKKFVFNRLAITNKQRCRDDTAAGETDSTFCMKKTDDRLQAMCCHFLVDTPCDDVLLGAAECQSIFGTYDIEIPINENAECGGSMAPDKNCKDFDRSLYTKMNVWFHYLYWSDSYPTGPDDPRCNTDGKKRDSKKKNHVGELLKSRLTLSHRPSNITIR